MTLFGSVRVCQALQVLLLLFLIETVSIVVEPRNVLAVCHFQTLRVGAAEAVQAGIVAEGADVVKGLP